MLKALRDIFTTANGLTHDLGRYSWAASWASITVFAAWHEFHGVAVNLTELCTAYSATAAAHAGALFMKRATEPQS